MAANDGSSGWQWWVAKWKKNFKIFCSKWSKKPKKQHIFFCFFPHLGGGWLDQKQVWNFTHFFLTLPLDKFYLVSRVVYQKRSCLFPQLLIMGGKITRVKIYQKKSWLFPHFSKKEDNQLLDKFYLDSRFKIYQIDLVAFLTFWKLTLTTGHSTHLWLAVKSQTNSWAFLSIYNSNHK